MSKHEVALSPRALFRDPFGVLRQMTSEFDRMLDESPFRARGASEAAGWMPSVDVFEKDNRLVTRVDLPGMKKEDVKVEVTDSHLAISGERKRESEEKGDRFYRCERESGSFYRAVPLPQGVKLEDIKATFADGVLEVSVPLPAIPAAAVRTVQIQEGSAPKKTTAA